MMDEDLEIPTEIANTISISKKCRLSDSGKYSDYEVLAVHLDSYGNIVGYLCQNSTCEIFNLVDEEFEKFKEGL